MDLVNLIVTQVVQSLMVPVKKHLGFLISSTKHVNDMHKEMDQLNLTEKDVQDKKKKAEANDYEVSHHVSPWLEDVKIMKEKTQSVPSGGIGCFNVAKRYKAGKQSYTFLEQIKALRERESKDITWPNTKKILAKVPSTSGQVLNGTQTTFESRNLVFNDVLQSLQSNNNESKNMIALCGMGGVGKTTMMEELKKVVEASKMFDWVVKVILGENNDPIAFQKAIAEKTGGDLTETAKDARADRLCERFKSMSQNGQKKILIIIDDIWKEVDLKDIGLTSPLPNGFNVLFTSRFEYVCTQMGVKSNSIFKVGVLNNEEAKTLFFGIVGPSLSNGNDQGFEIIGEDIVKQCGGLPIAIVTIAKYLRGNIKEAWELALQRLVEDDLKDLESITRRIFEISYENIKEDAEKVIYLLCGLFPDDFDIRCEDLLRFGWALGFFSNAGTLTKARKAMKVCVNNLIRANLLTESDRMGCVKMHDLVRAFVLNKISEVKQVSIVKLDNDSVQPLTKDANESYHRILLKCTGITEFPANFNYPNLSMLMLMDGRKDLKFPENIYDRMEELQVVSYEDMSIPSVLLTFQHSTKIRTLGLRSCRFINDDISLLGSLSNLETLSIVDCELRWLPSAIGNLKKLKLLDLTGCVDLRIDDGVFQNLDSLEELYMRADNNSFILFTDANCDELKKLSDRLFALEFEFFENKVQPENMSFKNLKRFRISIGCKLVGLESGEKNLFRNTIQLVGDCHELLECKISELFTKTEELHLQVNKMYGLEDVLQGHSFSDLTVLHISECEHLEYLFKADVASGLKKLERLTISECPMMRTIIFENSRFQNLKFMSLTDLPNMESLSDNVIEFPEMVELILDGLPKFKSIYPHSHNKSEMLSFINQKVVVPQLENLNISNMENLEHIWSCETIDENKVSMLRKIEVSDCYNLINLFPSNPFPLLNHLEKLKVENCGSIEVLFNMEIESVCGTREYYSCKLRSIGVRDLGKLKELWRMKSVNNCDIHDVKCFKGVERIFILDCPIFKNIFTPTTINFDLGGLTTFVTYYTGEEINDVYTPNARYPSYLLHMTPQLQHLELDDDKRVKEVVFEMDNHQPLLLPYLEDLTLRELRKMSHVWKYNWNKFSILHHPPLQLPFRNLTNISLFRCHKLKYLFSPLMANYLSNLKEVHISFCDGFEEIISSRDDETKENTTSASYHQNSCKFFPHLDVLKLTDLPCLKSIHGKSQSGQVIAARSIEINECPALSSLVPRYAAGHMERLQELVIGDCETMKEVLL